MHSKFPWVNHPHTPTAVFDGDGRRIIDQWVAPEGWLPIETAPKDSCIMLCVHGWQPSIGRWWPKDECWTAFDWEGHFETDAELTSYVQGCKYEPTHWQPLPAPPSDAPTPTPLDPETAAANAVMIAGLPGLIEALEASKYTLEKIGHKTDWDTSEAVARINSALSSARKE